MLEVEIKNIKNEKQGVISLDEALFAVGVSKPLLHEVVTLQLASMRHGNAATKTRGLVSGGGKKPWKQKGTGRARAGSSRSPIWRGGGTIFGPEPRGYAYTMPRKKSRLALTMALSSKVSEGRLLILNELPLLGKKTKELFHIVEALHLEGKVLIVTSAESASLCRVASNLPMVKVLEKAELNVYDLLSAEWLLTTKEDVISMGWGNHGTA